MYELRAGSRESRLAVVQTELIGEAIRALHPGTRIGLVTMKTTGDKILDRTLDKVGGKGLFVKELDAALLDGRIDFAVHSCKDLPMELSPGLRLGAFSRREDPRDVLILPEGAEGMDPSKPIGCASARRALQLKALFPGQPVAPGAGQRAHPPPETGPGRVRRPGAGGGRGEAPGPGGADRPLVLHGRAPAGGGTGDPGRDGPGGGPGPLAGGGGRPGQHGLRPGGAGLRAGAGRRLLLAGGRLRGPGGGAAHPAGHGHRGGRGAGVRQPVRRREDAEALGEALARRVREGSVCTAK